MFESKWALAKLTKIWTGKSADDYFDLIRGVCQLLNETVEAQWDDAFALSLRSSLVRSVVSAVVQT